MKGRQVTIKDIAKELNISVSTVSRALRGLPDVNSDTRKAVEALAKKLHYHPNAVALSLVKSKTHTVGIIIPNFVIHLYSSAIVGIQDVLSAAGYNIMICQSNEAYTTEVNNVQTLISSRVDGLIVALSKETQNFDHFKLVLDRNIPVVSFNRTLDDLPASKVEVDDYDGAFNAVEYLIRTGCQRIGHVAGPQNLRISQLRLRGYQDALAKYQIPFREEYVKYCDFSIGSGKESMTQLLLLPEMPDAVFVVNDYAAFGVISALKERRINIPDEVSVVGFTDEPFSSLIEPSLTTVSQPTYEIGRATASLFLKQVNCGDQFQPETYVLKTELKVRNSTRKLWG